METSSQIKTELLSSKDAGAQLGYTHDYISRLCRHGKMSGVQKGREWFVTQAELDLFKGRHELELIEKKKELSKKFSRIRTEHEAKKRKAREEALSSTQTTPEKSTYATQHVFDSKKSLRVVVPREFVAAFVLAFVLLAPSVFSAISNNTSFAFPNIDIVQQASVFENVRDNLEQGIQDTIYAQSTIVEPAAAFFSFAPYLADGYWQFFNTVGKLPQATFNSLQLIGNGYLTLYELQGIALYQSMGTLNTMGASVLKGYELIGESFVFGSKDIMSRYARLFHFGSTIQTSQNQFKTFAANVSGGFDYVQKDISGSFLENFIKQITSSFNFIFSNIGTNIYAMHVTVFQISQTMSAYVGSLFDFNLANHQSKIRTLKRGE